MWLLQKSKNKVSSRQQIGIKEIRDGILILPRNQYRVVIETSSVNFELKSEAEQDSLIDNFQNFLNSLPSPIQILVRVRELDIDHYLEQISKTKDKEKEKKYKEQIDNYCEFIKNLIAGNKILSRRFFVVLPYQPLDKNTNDFNLIKEQLHLNQEIIIKGLEKLGMKAKALDSIQTLELFYNFYNPTQAKSQELKQQTVEALFNQTAYV